MEKSSKSGSAENAKPKKKVTKPRAKTAAPRSRSKGSKSAATTDELPLSGSAVTREDAPPAVREVAEVSVAPSPVSEAPRVEEVRETVRPVFVPVRSDVPAAPPPEVRERPAPPVEAAPTPDERAMDRNEQKSGSR